MEIEYWLVDHGFQDVLMVELNEYLLNKNPKVYHINYIVYR